MKKILIADDKATGRELVRTVLEKAGYEVFEAADGEEALQEAKRVQPDMLVLDLHMPRRDGFEVMRALRQIEEFTSTPVLALTASAMMGDRERAIEAGFNGYITKPISLSSLRSEIERLLR